MSTDYYLYEGPVCAVCGHQPRPRHIGNSSVGWAFALRLYPEDGITSLDDWAFEWNKPGAEVRDVYGRIVSLLELMAAITQRDPMGRKAHTSCPFKAPETATYEYVS